MPSSRRAVIDIGTNSIKLLLADVNGGAVAPLLEKSEQTRLGTGFYEDHRLQPEPVARTAEAAARFAREAREQGAKSFRIVATSAVRDAVNPEELLRAVAAATGVEVEVISGRREAELTFRGVTSDSSLPAVPLLVMDLGGGSTEFIVGHHGVKQFEGSFPLGTVRLLNQCAVADPPTANEREECRQNVEEFLRAQVAPGVGTALASCPGGPALLVGTGGTSTLLAVMHQGLREFNRAAIEAARMGAGDIESRLDQLWSLSLAARRELPGLPANRADVMLMGVVVYASVLRVFGLGEMRSSTRGLRHAVLLDEEVTA